MQVAVQIQGGARPMAGSGLRLWRREVMLVGFTPAASRIATAHLSAMAFLTRTCGEPYDGLADLIDDPAGWMACIVDASAFATEVDLEHYLQLLSYEGRAIGVILVNADPAFAARTQSGKPYGVDVVVADATDPAQIHGAMSMILARRGFVARKPIAAAIRRVA